MIQLVVRRTITILGASALSYIGLSTSAVFPPEPPSQSIRGARLFRLLRPELVKAARNPLCSDAFSRFQVEGLDNFNRDVQQTHAKLLTTVIPDFSAWLSDRYSVFEHELTLSDVLEVEVEAHRRGINFRHLGLVRQNISDSDSPRARVALATAVSARVIKNIIRTHSRALKATTQGPFRKLALSYLNLIFAGATEAKAAEFWNKHLRDRIEKSFPGALSATEETTLPRGRFAHESALFGRILRFLGITLVESSTHDKIQSNNSRLELLKPLADTDIASVSPVTRASNRFSLEQATAIAKKSLSASSPRYAV